MEFTEVNELDLSKGIDKRNAENQLTPGHWEDLVNAEIEGRLVSKRKGYQQIGGYLPFRVTSVNTDVSEQELCFNLNSYVDLSRLVSTPIRVSGYVYDSVGNSTDYPINTFVDNYYTDFSVTVRRSGNSVIPQSAHGHTTALQHSDVAESLSLINLSYSEFFPDQHIINFTSSEIDGLDNTTINLSQGIDYIHYSYDASVLGPNYYPNTSGTPAYYTHGGTGSEDIANDFDILSVLSNTNLIVTVYEKTSAGVLERVQPDDVRIFNNFLSVDINSTDVGSEFIYIATAVPAEQVVAGQTIGATTTETFTVDNPFNIVAIYTTSTIGLSTTKEWVEPDAISYDDVTKELSVTFTSDTNTNYEIYYLPADLQVNQLCVTDPNLTGSDVNTSNIELDIYGLDPAQSFEVTDRNHWITHIDTYRSFDISKLIAGVAGNEYELASPGSDILFPRIRAIAEIQYRISPLFQDTGTIETVVANRGFYTFDNGSTGGTIDSGEHLSGNTYRFTILAPNLDSYDQASTQGEEPDLINDLLTVSGMGYSVLNGRHPITAITKDTVNDLLLVDVTIDEVDNSDFDEQDAGGLAQVYTSYIPMSISSPSELPYLPGDRLVGGPIPASANYVVRGIFSLDSGAVEAVAIDNVTDVFEISGGSFIYAQRNSYLLPTRSLNAAETTSTYLKGDMVKYSAVDRLSRIKNLIIQDTSNISITGDIITLPAGEALNYETGQKVAIQPFGVEGGEFTITEIVDSDNIRVDNTFTSTSGRFIGKLLELDESFTYTDTVDNSEFFIPTAYWKAINKPALPSAYAGQGLVESVVQQFNSNTSDSQSIIRSVMAADNMYLTNKLDEVLKYDGLNLSRAGLFRFEAGVFVNKVEEGVSAAIPNSAPSVDNATISADNLRVVTGSNISRVFTVGQEVSIGGSDFTITEIDRTNDSITLNRDAASGANITVSGKSRLKYYFRLNAIDANNNIIGSAVSGANNTYVVELSDTTTIGIKIAIPPRLRLLDYERIEVQTYRTKQQGEVFFLLSTESIPYTSSDAYIYFEDTADDSVLTQADLLATATFGAELPTALEEPLRARHITSSNNRLILANVQDYPKIDLELLEGTANSLDGLSFSLSGDTDITYEFSSTTQSATIETNRSISFTTPPSSVSWVYLYQTSSSTVDLEYLGWFRSDHIFANAPSSAVSVTAVVGGPSTVPIYPGLGDNNSASVAWNDADIGLQFLKLARAINATSGQVAGPNWLRADGGLFETAGQVSIRSFTNPFTLDITGIPGGSSLIANNKRYLTNTTGIESVSQRYPSRMLVSFPNFPEIFDRPRAIVEEDSLSVIDVNSADGQEITGVIPFFGESTSQDSQKQDIVICFKENSIYAVNIRSRQITKIDSRSIGCDAPFSIAAVPNGIIFASKSGVYRLNRGFDVIWAGNKLDREWDNNTNFSQIRLATGHVYPEKQQYRLSVPVGSNDRATEAYVYNYGDETAGQVGAWATFDNIPSTGWASDGTDSFFGSSIGRVFVIRNNGTDSDYRDDDQPVSWSGTYRATDFGAPGKRKILRAVVSQFRVLKQDSGTTLEVAVDMTDDFSPTTSFVIDKPEDNNLSSTVSQKVKTIRQNVGNQKGVYYQLRYRNATIDTPVTLSGITYKVAGLKYNGITQAAETSD